MTNKPINLVAIQLVSSPDIDDNFEQVIKQIEQAQTDWIDEYPTLVVLPECFAFFGGQDKAALELLTEANQQLLHDQLSDIANTYRIWLVAGSVPTPSPDINKMFATAWCFDPFGDLVDQYDKIHLFDVTLPKSKESYNESKYFMPGDKIEVIDTPIGRAGIACCYDLRFPELFRLQQEKKVDVIILPASFTEQTGKVHWETLIKARAIENLSFVVSSCQGGYHINGKKTFGHTMIVNPWGQTLDILEKGKGFISSDIDLSQLKSIRENFPVLEHMKLISKK